MKKDDLFNAINEINTKYITDAWNNTAPESDTVVYESPKHPKAKIIGAVTAFAALISAACLAVYVRVNQLPNDEITPADPSAISEMSGISESISGALSSTDSLLEESPELPPADSEFPIELYGPDMIRIKYGDVTGVTLAGGEAVTTKDFDPSNWESVICDGFTYLAEPLGINYIGFDREEAIDMSEYLDGIVKNDTYKRYNVGDKFGGLTVKSAMSIFHKNSAATGKLWECVVEFDGELTVNGYIVRDVGNDRHGTVFRCLPVDEYDAIPVMSPTADGKGYASKIYTGEYLAGAVRYCSRHPDILLKNDNGFNLQNVMDLFNGVNYAAVTLKLSDIHMASMTYGHSTSDLIIANIEDIKDYTGERPEDSLPFELYGLDGKQILFSDVTEIVDTHMNKIENDDLTADNWFQIWCEGMCYLGAPTGKNYNSLDEPYSFDDTGEFCSYSLNMHDYERYNVGEGTCGLAVSSAMTVFVRTSEINAYKDQPMAQKLQMSNITFNGQTKLRAYLTRDRNGVLSCIPLKGETSLPVLSPGDDFYSAKSRDGCFVSADGTKIFYHTELPQIYLENQNGLDLSEYFGDKDYVKVELTLDNVSMTYSRLVEQNCGITANIAEISAA